MRPWQMLESAKPAPWAAHQSPPRESAQVIELASWRRASADAKMDKQP